MKNSFYRARDMRFLFLLADAFAVLFFQPAAGAQPTNFAKPLAELRAQLDAHINQPRFSGALWGVKIVSLDTGKIIYENHADRLMSPASNSKLYAGALALDTLGGDYEFATPILATARPDAAGVPSPPTVVMGTVKDNCRSGQAP